MHTRIAKLLSPKSVSNASVDHRVSSPTTPCGGYKESIILGGCKDEGVHSPGPHPKLRLNPTSLV